MKIKLNIIARDVSRPEFNFEKFCFYKSAYPSISNKYIFTLTGIFLPANVCRRLEKYFGEMEFRSELNFDGYNSLDNAWYWECDDEEDEYEDYYES